MQPQPDGFCPGVAGVTGGGSAGLTTAVAHPHHRVDIAAGVEIRLQLHPDGIRCRDKVIQDAVGDLFVGDRSVAVAVHVQLDRLQLHHPRARLIDQPQHGEIGIAREGALAGEFRQFDRHLIGPTGARVVETDQLRLRNGALAVERCLGLLISQGSGLRTKVSKP